MDVTLKSLCCFATSGSRFNVTFSALNLTLKKTGCRIEFSECQAQISQCHTQIPEIFQLAFIVAAENPSILLELLWFAPSPSHSQARTDFMLSEDCPGFSGTRHRRHDYRRRASAEESGDAVF